MELLSFFHWVAMSLAKHTGFYYNEKEKMDIGRNVAAITSVKSLKEPRVPPLAKSRISYVQNAFQNLFLLLCFLSQQNPLVPAQ